jgi:hypothetical protein
LWIFIKKIKSPQKMLDDDALLRVKKALVACDFHLKWVSLNVFFKWFFSTHYIYCVTLTSCWVSLCVLIKISSLEEQISVQISLWLLVRYELQICRNRTDNKYTKLLGIILSSCWVNSQVHKDNLTILFPFLKLMPNSILHFCKAC